MSTTIREDDIDVNEIHEKLTPQAVDEALGALNVAMLAMFPLKAGYPEGTSPAVLRALFIVQQALEEALDPNDAEVP